MYEQTSDELQFAFRLDTDAEDRVISVYHYACTVCTTSEYLHKPVCYFLDTICRDNAELRGHGQCRIVESKGIEGRRISVFVQSSEVASLPKTGHLTDLEHFSRLYAEIVKPSTIVAIVEPDKSHALIELMIDIGLQCASREDTVLTSSDRQLILALPEWDYRDLLELKNRFAKRAQWALREDLGWKWGFALVTDETSAKEAISRASNALVDAQSNKAEFSYAS